MQSLWMLLASLMFAIMGAFVKVATEYGATMPQIIFFRGLPSIVLLLLWARTNNKSLRPKSWRLHFWRNVSGVSSMWLAFYAMSNLPLPMAISLNYTAPLFIAGWMLTWGGAQRDYLRVLTVIVGFVGVLLILRPSADINTTQQIIAIGGLAAGALAAVAMMQIRQLGRLGEPEWRTVLFFSCFVVFTSLVGVYIYGWQPLNIKALIAIISVGTAGLIGQLAVTRAFGAGSALLSAALQYTIIIFATIISAIIWRDTPDLLAFAGMALIIAAGLLSAWRTYSEDKLLKKNDIKQDKPNEELENV